MMNAPRALGALALLSVVAVASHAQAVGTRTFDLDSLEDFKGGDLTGVSVDSNGNVRAGLTLGSTPITDASSAWSSALLGDGSVMIGTGNEGKVFLYKAGSAKLTATTGQMAASALAVAWNGDVIVGTFPEGKLYRVPAAGNQGGEAKLFATLKGAEDIWSLAYDAKAKALYAATGPEGKLFRIDEQGKEQVYFDSDEAHLMSVAVGEDGSVYTGSNGKALLYKVSGPGRATVLYDFDADDVKLIAVAPASKGGAVYAVANKYNEPFASPKRTKLSPPGPQAPRPAKPGKGLLMRFGKDGVAEAMLDDDDTHYASLALDDNGMPYVGTGAEGRLWTVDDNHLARLVADTDERQITGLHMSGNHRVVVSSDQLVVHEVKGQGGADAVWTSKALDCGLRANFGKLSWRADGALELSTRTGNTSTPDTTWSAWSAGLASAGDVKSPAGRYVQVRARWSRDPKAVLHEVVLPFVTDNARAIVTSIDASSKRSTKAGRAGGVQASGGEAPRPSTSIKLSWKVDNADQDELRYRVWYRMESESAWRSAQKPGDKLTSTSLDWDTSTLPEGNYRLMVEASDELANPPDRALKHSLESGTVLVDNTPPVFKSLAITGRQLKGEVTDGLGPIARIEVSIAGSDEWRPLFPKDGVFDEASEVIDANLTALVPAGAHLLVVRAYDTAGNVVTKNVEAK
jgi:hypothetical protein